MEVGQLIHFRHFGCAQKKKKKKKKRDPISEYGSLNLLGKWRLEPLSSEKDKVSLRKLGKKMGPFFFLCPKFNDAFLTQPATVVCKMEAQLEHVHVFARLSPICKLSRCLLTKFPASELRRRLIKSALLVGHSWTHLRYTCLFIYLFIYFRHDAGREERRQPDGRPGLQKARDFPN